MKTLVKELRKEATWLVLLLAVVWFLPITWWSSLLFMAIILGLPQLFLWLVLMKKFVKHYAPQEYFSGNSPQPGFAIIGDSIAAGYGTSDEDYRPHRRLYYFTRTFVKMESAPFFGTKSLPGLLEKLGKTDTYEAIVMSVGGNDAIPVVSGSLLEIREALTETLTEATGMTKRVILLENFSGLGEVYPVWWLRIIFRKRGEKVRRIYDEILFPFPEVTRMDISPILTNRKNLARDGVHPGKKAYIEISHLLIPELLRLGEQEAS